MSLQEPTRPIDIENAQVFDYQRDVIVELHGETPDGEFEAVTYVFRNDPDERGLQPPEIDTDHEEAVHEALDEAEADYTLA